jgi:hypothetical protein
MDKEAKKVEVVKKEIVELNTKFHDKQLLSGGFYKQLMQSGFVCKQCLLISIFPDGTNTYCGQIIRQDGHVFDFDIDLDSSEYTSWKDITENFRETYGKNKINRPWLKEVVADKMFGELRLSPND